MLLETLQFNEKQIRKSIGTVANHDFMTVEIEVELVAALEHLRNAQKKIVELSNQAEATGRIDLPGPPEVSFWISKPLGCPPIKI